MLRSDAGPTTGFAPTSTVPSVAGKCGRSPAIRRSTVDLPQPDGPRIAMNSPLPGMSSTLKVTSRMMVRSPNFLVTFLKSTTLGAAGAAAVGSATSVRDLPVGKQAALEPEQRAIDAEREQPDDDQNEDDVFRQAAPLARHQQVSETVLRGLSEKD